MFPEFQLMALLVTNRSSIHVIVAPIKRSLVILPYRTMAAVENMHVVRVHVYDCFENFAL